MPTPSPAAASQEGRLAVRELERFTFDYVEREERSVSQVLESHRDFARTYFTMASGALALSILMAQFLQARGAMLRPLWALAAAWVCFAATLILSAARHNIEAKIRLKYAKYHQGRRTLSLDLLTLAFGPDFTLEAMKRIRTAEMEISTGALELGRTYDLVSRLIALSCIAGYSLLVFFAIRSLV